MNRPFLKYKRFKKVSRTLNMAYSEPLIETPSLIAFYLACVIKQ